MATSVYTSQDILLQDGREAVLRPANIALLKKFNRVFNVWRESSDPDESLDLLVDSAAVLLSNQHPDYWDKSLNDGRGGHTEAAEEALDEETVFKILEVAGGIKLNTPEVLAAAMEATKDGTN